ncbi:hypothetical protein [Thioclava sp. IC9]|uniref:hypothetical protein n=1 Tax=Thioclava sp. IC9 TaxID=1973007 RepID=UPI001130F301|nr:hypothetical protein [Thioclava sp. IC9]
MKTRAPEFSNCFPNEITGFSIKRKIRLVKNTHEAGSLSEGDFATTKLQEFLAEVEKSEPETTYYSIAQNNYNNLQQAINSLWEEFPNRSFARIDIAGNECEVLQRNIGTLSFTGRNITATDSNFFELNIRASGDILIMGSKVAKLHTSTTDPASKANLRIERTTLLSWDAQLESFRSITLIATKAAKRYKRLRVPERLQSLRLDRESYAQLNNWAEKKGNSKLAHFARGHELSIEKEDAERAEKFFFVLWSSLSDYGLSFWRPLIILFLTLLLLSTLLFATGTTLFRSDINSYAGWQGSMVGNSLAAQSIRALVGSIEGIFSPFSLFSARRLVVPCQPWVAFIQFFVSYFSIGLVFLFGFAVRRRFKV